MYLPAVILVRPQLPENVGGVARVLHNFGFCDLRLVCPKVDFLSDKKATACACSGLDLLQSAKLYDTVADAAADLDYLFAATARTRYIKRSFVYSRHLQISQKNTGILFGPENSGLSNDDMAFCDSVVCIEAKNNPLNLVHSVAILAYQCSTAGMSCYDKPPEIASASKKELTFLYDTIGILLDKLGFFSCPEKRPVVMLNIAAMLSRCKMTSQDVQTFLGMLKFLSR